MFKRIGRPLIPSSGIQFKFLQPYKKRRHLYTMNTVHGQTPTDVTFSQTGQGYMCNALHIVQQKCCCLCCDFVGCCDVILECSWFAHSCFTRLKKTTTVTEKNLCCYWCNPWTVSMTTTVRLIMTMVMMTMRTRYNGFYRDNVQCVHAIQIESIKI